MSVVWVHIFAIILLAALTPLVHISVHVLQDTQVAAKQFVLVCKNAAVSSGYALMYNLIPSDCCVLKFLQRSADGKHLMRIRFQIPPV